MANHLRRLLLVFASSIYYFSLFGQMHSAAGVSLGNEWIKYDNTYYKFEIDQDGVYRISGKTLAALGLDLSQTDGLRMMHNGKEEALFFSNGNVLGENDYLEFVGFKSTIALDTFLYDDWQTDLLNPYYGLFTDVSAYYLTIDKAGDPPLRYTPKGPDFDPTGLATLNSFRFKEIVNFSASFYKPQIGQLKYSHFQPSEGYTSGLRSDYSANLNLKGIYTGGSDAILELRMSSNNDWPIIKEIKFNGEVIGIDTAGAGKTAIFNKVLSGQSLKESNKIDLRKTSTTGLFGLANANIVYDRTFDFTGISFLSADVQNQQKTLIKLTLPSGAPSYVLDFNNLQALTLNNNKEVVVESNAKLAISSEPKVLSTGKVRKFKDLKNINASYLFLTSEKLYPENRVANPIDDYAAYRSSQAGGAFKTHVITTEEIYDQFGFGIPNHNWPFKNMSAYLHENWPALHYVLIVGKAREYENVRTKELLANPLNQTFFVPTFGSSPSDVLLFSPGRYVNTYFSIGRIAATSLDDVAIYLNKIKAHDLSIDAPQEEDKLWLKNIVHLGGGANAGEQSSIKWFLDRMTDTITTGEFGGQVSSFFKTSSSNVQVANLEGIRKNINNGASVITFFGHAAVGTFEFSLDKPESYANEGKYPFIFSLGCYSGNIHTPSKGISEEFLFAPNRGAIGFIASAGTAYLSTQGVYGTKFYAKLTSNFYGKRLGDMFKEFGEQEKDVFNPGEYTLYQQLTFHGDPAAKLHGFEKSDFTIDYGSIKTNPSDILIHNSEFDVTFDVMNIGRSTSEKLNIRAIHIGPNGDTVTTKNISVDAPPFERSYKITLPIVNDVRGSNRLLLILDPGDDISELSESNNQVIGPDGSPGFVFNILADDIFGSYPPNFAIVNDISNFELIASSSNSLVGNQDYVIQLDTTEFFNSPQLTEQRFLKSGPFIKWKPSLDLIPNKVYYWRVGRNEQQVDRERWSISTFIYDPQAPSEGWNQSEFYQYNQNSNNIIVQGDGNFKYNNALRNVSISNGVTQLGAGELIGYSVDFSTFAVSFRPWEYMDQGVAFTMFDPLLGRHTPNLGGQYNSINTTATGARGSFGFKTETPEQRKLVVEFIENHVPKGTYVSFMTIMRTDKSKLFVDQWESDTLIYGNSIVKALKNQGAAIIDQLIEVGDRPYTFMFKKDEGVRDEGLAESVQDIVKTQMDLVFNDFLGSFESVPIGPAKSWGKITIDKVISPNNTSKISVIGIKPNESSDTLFKNIVENELDISHISANDYPYLKIYYTDENPTNRTPTILNSLRVYYQKEKDLIAKGDLSTELFDTIQQGQSLSINLPIFLLGSDTLESVDVMFSFNYGDNKKIEINKVFNKLKPGENMFENIEFKTIDLLGSVGFSYEINGKKDIREFTYDNNFGSARFYVLRDNLNPYIIVYQDTEELVNNAIVPGNPRFNIELRDNNKFLRNDAPDAIVATIKDALGNIVFNSIESQVLPAHKEDNDRDIMLLSFDLSLEDGKYSIFVQGKDASGNLSTEDPIEIAFEVENTIGISKVYNFPNPFNTQTNFSYELGGDLPAKLELQIYSSTGTLIQRINLSQVDLPKLGSNTSSFAWTGTDSSGNRLASGIYFYTLKAFDSNNKPLTSNKEDEFKKLIIIR
ncbi:MAG: hypothetical protein KDC49_12780 [Saprospiraceae bacterium]|nr:hypothetical protein [Saprospiraceae bacterium]